LKETLRGANEANVLTLLCTSDDHAPRLVLEISASIFSSRSYRRIAEVAIDYVERFGRAPGPHLIDLLEPDMRRGEEGKLMERIVGDIQKLAPALQPEYVLGELGQWLDLRHVAKAAEAALDAVDAGNLKAAQDALHRAEIKGDQTEGIFLHDPDAMLSFMQEREEDYFPLGIDVLDRMGVRPQRKEMMVAIGNKKIGKSWFLIQASKMALMHRQSVLYITLEMRQEKVARRFIMAVLAMSSREVGKIRVPVFKKDKAGKMIGLDWDELTPDAINPDRRAAIAKQLARFKARPPLLIKEFSSGSLTVPQLRAYLRYLEKTKNFKPDLLVVDYAGIMQYDEQNARLSMARNFLGLRQLCQDFNMAGLTVWQGNRTTDTAKTVTSSMASEAYKIVQDADVVITISRTGKERQLGLARILVDAGRDVEDKVMVMITQNYSTGQFCLDSVYMSKFVDAEVNRITGDGEEGGDDPDES